jgi:PAS domain S-box-containing protein
MFREDSPVRRGANLVLSRFFKRYSPIFQGVLFGVILPISVGFLISGYLIYRHHFDIESLSQRYVLEQKSESRDTVEKIDSSLYQIHNGLKTLALSPGIRDLESSSLDEETLGRIVEVTSSFSTQLRVQSLDLQFVKTNRKFSFDQTAGMLRPTDFRPTESSEPLESNANFKWFKEKFPVKAYATLVDYPSVLAQYGEDEWRYEVPIFGTSGEISGMLCAKIPASELQQLLGNGDDAIVDQNTGIIVSKNIPGTVESNRDLVKRAEPAPNQVYSEVLPLNIRDKRSDWHYWILRYDDQFWNRIDVQDCKSSLQLSIFITWLLVLGAIFSIRTQKRRQELKFNSFVRNSQELIIVLEPTGHIEHVIGQLKAQTGWKNEELLGLDFRLFLENSSRPIMVDLFSEVLNHSESTESAEIRFEVADGSFTWYEVTATNMLHVAGIGGVLLTLRNIESRKNSEATIIAAKESAERANEAKSEFLSRMSHELRTPLNAILGFGQLLEMSDLKKRDQEGVEQIMKAGRHLLNLVNDILDIARIETRKLSLSIETVQCDAVISEAVTLISPLASRQNIPIHVDCDPNLHVFGDNQRLKQVLLNLLSNAVKYNSELGEVFVTVRQKSESVQISVRDTGNGIEPSQLRRLFTPFDRLGADRSSIEGSGLGLALSKTMIEAMNGQIEVQSTIKQGTTFTLILPFAEPSVLTQKLSERKRSRHSFQNSKLLYIEDNLANLKLVKDILELNPRFELLTAVQGGMGIEMAQLHQPDIILLDLDLPDISGVEVLKSLREHPETRNSTIVIMSAEANENKIHKVFELGADDFLAKPINIKKFMELLEPVRKAA